MGSIIPKEGLYPNRPMQNPQEVLNDPVDRRMGVPFPQAWIDYARETFGIKKKEVKEPPKPEKEGGKFATYVDPRISRAARAYAGNATDRLAYGLAAYDALMKNQKIEHLPPAEMIRRYKNHEGFEEGDTNYIGAGPLRDMLVRLVHESKAKHLRKKKGVSHYDVHPEVIATQEADAAAYRSEARQLMKHPLAKHLFN